MATSKPNPPRQRIVQSRTKVVEHQEEHVIEDAVVFIKNINPHEILVMHKPDAQGKGGKTMQFKGTKHITNDEEEIEFLTRLAEAGGHGILIQDAPVKAPASQIVTIPPQLPEPPTGTPITSTPAQTHAPAKPATAPAPPSVVKTQQPPEPPTGSPVTTPAPNKPLVTPLPPAVPAEPAAGTPTTPPPEPPAPAPAPRGTAPKAEAAATPPQ